MRVAGRWFILLHCLSNKSDSTIKKYIVKHPCWVVSQRRAMKYLTAVLFCAAYTLLFQFSKGRQESENQHVSTGTLSAFSTIVIILLMFFCSRDPMFTFYASHLSKMNVIRYGKKKNKTINKLNDSILSTFHDNSRVKCGSRSSVYL